MSGHQIGPGLVLDLMSFYTSVDFGPECHSNEAFSYTLNL